MNTTRLTSSILASLCLVAAAHAQDLTHKAPHQSKTIAITGAMIHPVSAPAIENATIVFSEGRITSIYSKTDWERFVATSRINPAEFTTIDAAGKHVYPGLIVVHTQLGLTEIQAVPASIDIAETGNVTPEVCAVTAVNPDSTLIPVTRSNGVLLAGVFPDGGVISGQPSVIRLDGWTNTDLAVRASIGLYVRWPNLRPITAWWMDRSEDDQLKDIRRNLKTIEEAFDTAKAYADAKAADPESSTDLRWDAMTPLFTASHTAAHSAINSPASSASIAGANGSAHPANASASPEGTPRVYISASDVDQINSAVAFATSRGVRPVIVGGRDAALCADLLKKHDVPVIIMGTHAMPRRDDSPVDDAFTLPARLHAAGVRFAIANRDDAAHERNVPYAAAMAVAHGLDHDVALRAITLSAAEILGVSTDYGSLEPGKSATLIITTGDPLQITTHVTAAYIDGRAIDLSNKQTKLYEKYRERYKQTGDLK